MKLWVASLTPDLSPQAPQGIECVTGVTYIEWDEVNWVARETLAPKSKRNNMLMVIVKNMSKQDELSWLPLADLPHPHLEQNLKSLGMNQLEIVELIQEQEKCTNLQVRADAGGLYACRYSANGIHHFVHGLTAIPEERSRLAQPILQSFQQGAWLSCLVSPGMGIVLPDLARYLEQRHRGEPKGLLCLELQPELLYAGLCLYDLAAELQTGRFLFALGGDWQTQLENLWERHHLETLDQKQITIHTGSHISEPRLQHEYQQAVEFAKLLHVRRRKTYFEVLHIAEQYWSTPHSQIKRVWTHTTIDRASGGMLLGLMEGFQEIGVESHALQFTDHLFTRFYRCAYDFYAYHPDLIMGINHSSNYIASFAGDVPIHRLIWYVDHPERTVQIPFHKHDASIVLSSDFIPEIQRRGGQVLGIIPAASTSQILSPPQHSDWRHDISYVGSVWDQREILESLGKNERDWVETIVQRQLLDPMRSLGEIIEAEPLPRQGHSQLIQCLRMYLSKAQYMQDRPLIEYFLYTVTNSCRRGEFMRSLFHLGEVGVYGSKDWLGLLGSENAHCYRGPINSAAELTELYRTSKINLCINSLQGFGFINVRAFEVPAAGGFLLAEWVQGLEEAFILDEELVSFLDVEELKNKIMLYLGDDERRFQVIRNAQKRIEQDHTYASRAKMILKLL